MLMYFSTNLVKVRHFDKTETIYSLQLREYGRRLHIVGTGSSWFGTLVPVWNFIAWLHFADIELVTLQILSHVFFSGLQTHRAVKMFKIMRSCSLPTNISIYNTMIECCKWLPCFKSASALLSLMLRDGFNPTVVTFTSLLKVSLAKSSTCLLDQLYYWLHISWVDL